MNTAARIILAAFLLLGAASAQEHDETVTLNTKSLKYHCVTCRDAKACTKNCIDVPVSEAKERGGVPCKRCGGTCKREGS